MGARRRARVWTLRPGDPVGEEASTGRAGHPLEDLSQQHVARAAPPLTGSTSEQDRAESFQKLVGLDPRAQVAARVVVPVTKARGVAHLSSRSELGARYRPIGTVSALVPVVAFVAYGLLALSWVTGFSYTGTSYVPSGSALQFSNGYRYVDWSVTVPLLTVELVGVLAVAGTRARTLRATWMSLAFVMIVTGFLGAEVFGYNDNNAARLIWGTISSIPMVIHYVMFFKEVKQSRQTLLPEAGKTLQNALWLLVAM